MNVPGLATPSSTGSPHEPAGAAAASCVARAKAAGADAADAVLRGRHVGLSVQRRLGRTEHLERSESARRRACASSSASRSAIVSSSALSTRPASPSFGRARRRHGPRRAGRSLRRPGRRRGARPSKSRSTWWTRAHEPDTEALIARASHRRGGGAGRAWRHQLRGRRGRIRAQRRSMMVSIVRLRRRLSPAPRHSVSATALAGEGTGDAARLRLFDHGPSRPTWRTPPRSAGSPAKRAHNPPQPDPAGARRSLPVDLRSRASPAACSGISDGCDQRQPPSPAGPVSSRTSWASRIFAPGIDHARRSRAVARGLRSAARSTAKACPPRPVHHHPGRRSDHLAAGQPQRPAARPAPRPDTLRARHRQPARARLPTNVYLA